MPDFGLTAQGFRLPHFHKLSKKQALLLYLIDASETHPVFFVRNRRRTKKKPFATRGKDKIVEQKRAHRGSQKRAPHIVSTIATFLQLFLFLSFDFPAKCQQITGKYDICRVDVSTSEKQRV